MIKVVGVRFREGGKVYFFNPKELDLTIGDSVNRSDSLRYAIGFLLLGNDISSFVTSGIVRSLNTDSFRSSSMSVSIASRQTLKSP